MNPRLRQLLLSGASSGGGGGSSADIGGWKVNTPAVSSTFAAGDGTQGAGGGMFSYTGNTGTRFNYVDPSQTVATTQLALDQAATYNAGTNPFGGPYYWNGTAIVDAGNRTAPTSGAFSGVPYGSDPENPGASVQWFKRVSYVLLQQAGGNRLFGTLSDGGDATTAGTYGYLTTGGRLGYPDWIGIKRGTTLSLEDDLYNNALEGNGALLRANLGGTLVLPGSDNAAPTRIFGAGPLATALPVITKCPRDGFMFLFGSSYRTVVNVNWTSLYFDGHDHSHYTGDRSMCLLMNFAGTPGVSANVWWEDCTFTGGGNFGTQASSDCTFDLYRCRLFDGWGDRVQGVFSDTTGRARLNLHDCLVARNGKTNDPVLNSGGTDNVYGRNFYQAGETSKDSIIENCIILPGGSEDQLRGGYRFERNFMMGGLTLGAQNGAAFGTAQANTGTIYGNAFERYFRAGTPHLGSAFQVFWGAHHVASTYNVVTDAGMSAADRSGAIAGQGTKIFTILVGGQPAGWYHPQLAACHDNSFSSNVTINRAGTVAFLTEEGIDSVGYLTPTQYHYIATDGAATWLDIGRYGSTTLTGAFAGGVSTGITIAGNVGGSPSAGSYTLLNGGRIAIALTAGGYHVAGVTGISGAGPYSVSIDAALPSGASNGAIVNFGQRANYLYPATNANSFTGNTVIGQSNTNANAKIFTLLSGAPLAPGDSRVDTTTYSGNTHLTLAAAAALGYSVDRCLYTYCISVGFTPSSTVQQTVINELVANWKTTMRKGQYKPAWTGTPIRNHIATGVGMAAI